eukprot:1159858-Pelagomonas_calceolata.AAC.5
MRNSFCSLAEQVRLNLSATSWTVGISGNGDGCEACTGLAGGGGGLTEEEGLGLGLGAGAGV